MRYRMELRPKTTIELLSEACVGLKGTSDNLERMLEKFPQKSRRGTVKYLLAGGWAVELLTGSEREHEDIDVLCVDEEYLTPFNTSIGPGVASDERAAIFYAMRFGEIPTRTIRRNYTQEVKRKTNPSPVVIPSTEFLLLSKIFEPLRDKDVHDVSAILRTQEVNPRKLADILRKCGTNNPEHQAQEIVSLSRDLNNQETSARALEKLRGYKGIDYS